MASTRVLMGAAMDAVGAAMEGRVIEESDSARMVAFVAGMVMLIVVVVGVVVVGVVVVGVVVVGEGLLIYSLCSCACFECCS